jgi:6-phosphogluconolactonase (cycloisomerase 2 family)
VRTIIATAIFALILSSFCSPLAAQTAQPAFLFLLEGKGVPTGTIHVFSVNPSTGAIIEVSGSPFNAGLIPEHLALDRTARFLYVINQQSQDITAFSVDASTGALTQLPGSPSLIGNQPEAMGIDPTGRFLYVSANGAQGQILYEFTIDSATGVLTAAPGSPQGLYATSFTFDPIGGYAYLSQGSPGPGLSNPILVCSIDFISGSLTPIGAGQPAAGGANVATVSPNGSLLYSVDSVTSNLDAFAVSLSGSILTETAGSPYPVPINPYSLAVHPSGNFLYVVNENQPYQTNYIPSQYDGSISAFTINPGTGALLPVPGSPFAAGINPLSIVIDPTGSFAYTTSTSYTSGYTSFAQIMGFSIDASSGILTPLPGTPWTDLANSNGAQLVITHGPLTTPNPVPLISSLSPPSSIATDVAFPLQINGINFVRGATVYFGGQPRSTTFVNSKQLNASILGSDIDDDGTAEVFVFNPLPGGGASSSVPFPISALSPIISSILPSSAIAGGIAFTMDAIGLNFVASSVINFNGTPQTTTYVSPTAIQTTISIAQIATPGTVSISVTTPTNGVPGGGTSNTVTLTILPPETQPVVTSISPTSATGEGPAFTLTVNGSGFVSGSQVSFNMVNVTTTLVSPTQLIALIPASAIAAVGYPNVIVTNPGGLVSVPVPFTVINPPPGGGTVTPPSVSAGSNALTLSVTGTGFTPSSVVLVNGGSRATTYVSSTVLQTTLLPTDLSQPGTLDITVINPPPGGGTTPALPFTVDDYRVTATTSSKTVNAGEPAVFSLIVAPANGTYSNPITFSATGLPIGATASFAPSAPIIPGATPQPVMLSISTAPHIAASTVSFPRSSHPALPLLFLAGLAIPLAGFCLRTSEGRVQRLAPQLFLALLIVAAVGLAACAAVGTGPASSPQLNPATGTPAGTYPVVVTATSGAVSHTTTVTLIVM